MEKTMHRIPGEDTRARRAAGAGVALAGYRQLRLGTVDWKRLAVALAGPALRRHRIRSASGRIWLDAICRFDCEEGGRPLAADRSGECES
jgi:hypothetical protein